MAHTLSALKKLPLFSELALVVLLASMVAGWLLPQTETLPSNIINTITTTSDALPDLNTLLDATLFGQAPQAAKAIAPAAQPKRAIVLSPLTLKLLGTVVAGDHSAAIIALKANGKQAAFFIGDHIQAGVVLKTVEANAIVVDHNGRMERISLEQGKKIISTAMPQVNLTATRPAIRPSTAQPTPPQRINKQMNRKHLQQQLQNIPALLSQALAKPHFNNGKMDGFMISSIVPGSLYAQAGLKNGDIIMAINGQKITNAGQAMTIYTQLKNAASLDLQLMRASSIQTIHFDIR